MSNKEFEVTDGQESVDSKEASFQQNPEGKVLTGSIATYLIKSSRFGTIEVEASKTIQLPSGLVGYDRPQIFALFDYAYPFHWLQSIDNPELAFVVIDGLEITKKLGLQIPWGDPDTDLRPEDEFAVILIVTIREPIEDSTVNLLAPIFVNMRNRRGVQVVYDDDPNRVRYPLFGGLLPKTSNKQNSNDEAPEESGENDKAEE